MALKEYRLHKENIFRSLILPILQCLSSEIQQIFNSFVWNGKKPRISMAALQRKRVEGGIAMPNILASCLVRKFGTVVESVIGAYVRI